MIPKIIETQWNVNLKHWKMLIKRQMEIIETYWNVNELKAAREEAAVARNNRNILECK